VAWVYRAINVLAEQVANVPFRFSRNEPGSEEQITHGPLPDFYARPHPQINRFQYWELRVIWLMLRGECFRIPIFDSARGRRRKLERIIIADPAHFQHVVQDHELVGWRYTGFGRNAPLSA
jgi:phage portal protein BeeE